MRSFLPYFGGKSQLAPAIVSALPEHRCYVEVFGGAGWVLFHKEESKVEILNDLNKELVTLYRVIKHHLDEFIRYVRWLLIAREEFQRMKDENPETLTDVQRAVRYYYILKNAWGGKVNNPTFSIGPTQPASFNLLRIEEELSMAHLRLARVYIEQKPYQDVVKRFDRPDTVFYLDPPYVGYENVYGKGLFSPADFEQLRDCLRDVQGKWLMSINDAPVIRDLYAEFNIGTVKTRYSTGSRNQNAKELLIQNF